MNRKVTVIGMLIMSVFFLFNAVSCSKSKSDDPATGPCSGTGGPLFEKVRSLIKDRCSSCHKAGNANGGLDFASGCTIVDQKVRIKVRAVDEGTMPQTGALPQSEKDIISAWINAGGLFTN